MCGSRYTPPAVKQPVPQPLAEQVKEQAKTEAPTRNESGCQHK